MAKLPALVDVIDARIAAAARGRRRTIALVLDRQRDAALRLLESDHRVLIAGDRFMPLWRIWKRRPFRAADALLAETRDALPIAPSSVDVLVFLRPFPVDGAPAAVLSDLSSLVRPGGLLLWTHPLVTGFWRRLLLRLTPRRRRPTMTARHELCRAAMAGGLARVEQRIVRRGLHRFALTAGTVPGGDPAPAAPAFRMDDNSPVQKVMPRRS
jgi:hypothetical protein